MYDMVNIIEADCELGVECTAWSTGKIVNRQYDLELKLHEGMIYIVTIFSSHYPPFQYSLK